jgi:hypothetical protein
MRLSFKNWGFGYSEREVPITLKIGTLEDVGKSFDIEFWQIGEVMKKESFDFMVELLYQGYLTACKESFKKPKYTRLNAIIWQEHLSVKSQNELYALLQELLGRLKKTNIKKKEQKVEQPGENSEVLQSENLVGA